MEPQRPQMSPGALDGLRVLDLSRFIAGPHCGMVLGDLGADVVKIERSRGGDDVRALAPHIAGESLYFFVFNRNKRSLALDLRSEEGKQILTRLIVEADVLVENFRPGTMEKMGLGWNEVHKLNPRLIMARISGYGQVGPRAGEPCFDAIAQATSGIMSITGASDGPPTLVGSFVVDYSTSLYATIGILAAIEQRHRTGQGQLVDVSLVGSGVSLLMTAIAEQSALGRTMSRVGNRDRYSAPAQSFRTKDGEWVYLIAGNDAHFPRLAQAMNRTDLLQDPRFSSIAARLAHVDEIEAIVAEFAAEHTSDEIIALTRDAEVPCARVATIETLLSDPQVREEGHVVTVEHPTMGNVTMQASPIRMGSTMPSVRRAAPRLGEHSQEVLDEWLGGEVEAVAPATKERAL